MSESATPSPAPQGQQPDASKSLVPALTDFVKAGHNIPPEAIKDIPPEVLDKMKDILLTTETHTAFSMRRSAPLPPPSELAAYNEIIPQGADRIMKMAEAQTTHRIDIEKKVVNSQQGHESKGQFFGFIIGIVGLLCGTFAAVSGQPVAGAAIAGTPLVGLVTAFLYSRRQDTAELEEKNEEMDSVNPQSPPSREEKHRKKNKKHRK